MIAPLVDEIFQGRFEAGIFFIAAGGVPTPDQAFEIGVAESGRVLVGFVEVQQLLVENNSFFLRCGRLREIPLQKLFRVVKNGAVRQ